MMERSNECGMYIIDKDYRIINFNKALGRIYPDVKCGDFCYKALAMADEPCATCPLLSDEATLFYNPIRREWINASAAEMEYPGHGKCYNIQFRRKTGKDVSDEEAVRQDEVDSHISELLRRTEHLSEENINLATGKQYLETLSYSVPGGYHRVGVNGGFPLIFVSDSFLEIVGRRREEVLNTPFLDIVAPEDREAFMALEPELASNGRINTVYRIVRGDGQCRWVQDSTQKVMQNGEEHYQCTLADITDFINRQEEMARQNMELLRNQHLNKTMEENMPSGYHRCAAKPGLPFLYIGRHFMEIVGFGADEIAEKFGNLYSNIIWPADREQIKTYEDMLEMRGKGNVYDTSVYRVKHRDGGYRWVTDSTMFMDMGEDSFFQGTIADISEYIEELEEARMKAEQSSQAKSAFLFNASHDIRTPMNAIQGFAHIIERNADDAAVVRETIRKIKQSGDTLMTLLNDVLELSRIERGKEDVSLQPLNILDHANKLYEMFASEMQRSGLSFDMENSVVHPHVLGDELKLTRIAMNLLSNARKFTPRGGSVSFGIHERECDGKTAVYTLAVRDTGIGMSQEFQSRAFEQFERERSSTDSGISGSGLGLAIIKKLSELMDGDCFIESAPGKGSTIKVDVRLPIIVEHSGDDAGDENGEQDFAGKRILLVEDNEFNREIARYILEDMKFTVEEAENGEVCVDMVREAGAGYYDMVLMDIQMPVLDGYSATVIIRRMLDRGTAGVPIIAMTANAFEEDRRKCMEVGMNGHIGKPIDPDVLWQTLKRVL